jgi:hypothetical protein
VASIWFADDGTLITTSLSAMISLNHRIDQFGTWSGIHTNIAKCRVTTFLPNLQRLPKKDRDDTLRARLSPLALQGKPVPILTQDEPLPGGYLGTQITAALTRTPHLAWAEDSCRQAVQSITNLPIQRNILTALLGYQGPARLNHTHHLALLTWNDVAKLDATLLNGVRHL